MVDSMIVCLSNAYMVEKSITTCLLPPPPRTQTGGDILLFGSVIVCDPCERGNFCII